MSLCILERDNNGYYNNPVQNKLEKEIEYENEKPHNNSGICTYYAWGHFGNAGGNNYSVGNDYLC